MAVGSLEAFANTMIDSILYNGFYNAQAQMGAFTASWIHINGVVDITVRNPLSVNSALIHIPGLLGIKNPTAGHFGTVNQEMLIII